MKREEVKLKISEKRKKGVDFIMIYTTNFGRILLDNGDKIFYYPGWLAILKPDYLIEIKYDKIKEVTICQKYNY